MYKNYKVVVNTAAGRRRYMQYLIPYVIACDIVDRYDLWVNTMNRQDIEFFKLLAIKYPKINLVWQPEGIINGNKSINAFYLDCIEDNTIYFKLDDDIIWMEPDLIERMVQFRIDNPHYFLVTPLVINNALSTYLLEICGKIKLDQYYNSNCAHNVLWKSGKFALDLHNWFYNNFLTKGSVSELHLGPHVMSMTRFSINAILWFGEDMKKFGGVVPGDDEEFLSCIYPSKQGLANCWNGDAIVSHFSFYTQRESLDNEFVLERYGQYLEEEWAKSKKYNSIFKNVSEAFYYVESHKDELPDSPYKSINVPQKTNKKFNWRTLLPYFIFWRLKRREDSVAERERKVIL